MQGNFLLRRLEIQQIFDLLEKKHGTETEKKQSYYTGLGNQSQFLSDYERNLSQKFWPPKLFYSCMFFVVHFWWKGKNYDADIEIRRYRGLIKTFLPDLYIVFEKNLRIHATLYDVAGNDYKAHNTGPFSAIRCYESVKTAWLITWVVNFSIFFSQTDKTKICLM